MTYPKGTKRHVPMVYDEMECVDVRQERINLTEVLLPQISIFIRKKIVGSCDTNLKNNIKNCMIPSIHLNLSILACCELLYFFVK